MRILDHHLQEVREALLMMAKEVTGSLRNAVALLHLKDEGLAETVLDREDTVDARELEIDELCLGLLARYQPEAGDLRFITMALQIGNDLERIGDHAVNLCRRGLDLLRIGLPPESLEVVAMGETAADMLENAIFSFLNQDRDLAQSILAGDDAMDDRRDHFFRTVVNEVTANPSSVEARLHLLLMSRDIERVADLSTNIAEDVFFIVTGDVLKHRAPPTDSP
jgi:phosphate transport system protein